MNKPDLVNHPPHYTSHPSGIEVIEYSRLLPFAPGSAVKYVMRRDMKDDPVQNIDKAIWFLTDAIDNGPAYYLTERMAAVIERVLPHEPHAVVGDFLRALYLPDPKRRGFALFGAEPDLILARDLATALREDYW